MKATIMVPNDYVGPVMELCQGKRGTFVDMQYLDENARHAHLRYSALRDRLRLFRRFKVEHKRVRVIRLRIDRLPAVQSRQDGYFAKRRKIDALSFIVHRDSAYERGKAIVEKLKDLIPRQQFEVPVQAAIGNKVIARSTIKALRKNVLAKCYGGDVSRKRKLLEKQKEGKKRMKQIGSVEVPQEAFMAVLKIDDQKNNEQGCLRWG